MWRLTSGACGKTASVLVDTDVLIWVLRGRESAREAIVAGPSVELSAVTYMELVQGVRDKEELRSLRRTIQRNGWRILPLTENIGQRATVYLENHALSDGLRLADALIAASAVESGAVLLTGNERHYRCVPGLTLERYQPIETG